MTSSIIINLDMIDQYDAEEADHLKAAASARERANAIRLLFGMPIPKSATQSSYSGTAQGDDNVPTVRPITAYVMDALNRKDPISYATLKENIAISLRDEGAGRKLSEASFYVSLKTLEDKKRIQRYKSHAFTVATFRDFEQKLIRGDVDDLVDSQKRSVLYTEIPQLLTEVSPTRLAPVEIKAQLLKSDRVREKEFGTDNRTLHRVISRLNKTGIVEHDEASSTYYMSCDHDLDASQEPEQSYLRLNGEG